MKNLKTYGIPRVAYNSDYMPGFWYDETTYTVDQNFKNIDDMANYLKLVDETNHNSSVLIFNKVPKKHSIKKNLIEDWINQSIQKAKLNLIRGKDLTPFLISEVNSLSKNKTLEANTSLIINNALLAGKISKKFNS